MPALDSLTLSVKHTCLSSGTGAELAVSLRSTSSSGEPAYLYCEVRRSDGSVLHSDTATNVGSTTFRFSPVADGTYTVVGQDQDGREASKEYTITCGTAGPAPDSCDLVLSEVQVFQPTQPGATGGFRALVSTTAATFTATATKLPDGQPEQLAGVYAPGTFQLYSTPEGSYRLTFTDARGCQAQQEFTINAAPQAEPGPVVAPVALWFAVGGLEPRPAYLPTPVSGLFGADNRPRLGLHVQVELRREDSEQPFARVRKTVRTQAEQVDISQALHTQLRPEARYPIGVVTHDADATLAFRARYREADAEGEGEWVEQDVTHYALLSALPALDSVAAYLASATAPAKPLSAFPSGQAVQWPGLPLELAVWLPERAADAVLYAECVYRDGLGRTLEVRSIELPASLAPGVTRVPLPARPPAQAATLTFQVVNPPRGTAPDVLPTVPEVHDYLIPDLNDNDYR